MGSYETCVVRRTCLEKVCNFHNNLMVMLWFYSFYFKCSSSVKLLAKVNPRCFATMPEKRKGEWQTFFSFLKKILRQPAC